VHTSTIASDRLHVELHRRAHVLRLLLRFCFETWHDRLTLVHQGCSVLYLTFEILPVFGTIKNLLYPCPCWFRSVTFSCKRNVGTGPHASFVTMLVLPLPLALLFPDCLECSNLFVPAGFLLCHIFKCGFLVRFRSNGYIYYPRCLVF
jgi:hypothetical protein